MSKRTLTPTEQAIVQPLVQQRTALQRELAAIERGILATVQAMHGEADPSLSFDPQSMTITTEGE